MWDTDHRVSLLGPDFTRVVGIPYIRETAHSAVNL